MLPELPPLTPDNYINRELSAIEFNRRVLNMARDQAVPLLERIRFISIVGSNLDEFFMVRVSSYIKKLVKEIGSARPDGYAPDQLVYIIRERTIVLLNELRDILRDLMHELAGQGIFVRHTRELGQEDRDILRQYFTDEVYPILTPLASDSARPFPFISNLSMNIGIYLAYPHEADEPEEYEFVRTKIPESLSRFVDLNEIRRKYGVAAHEGVHKVWVEDVISDNLDLLFPGMVVIEHHPFRVTRNADIDYEHEKEEQDEDFSELIENSVKERQFGAIVRLTVQDTISEHMLRHLAAEMDVVRERDIYIVDGALGSSSLAELTLIDRPDLKYPKYLPRTPEIFQIAPDIFTAIRHGDILMHHPYDTFAPVEEFFKAAAHDPQVVAIKATLYRVGKDSPLVKSLLEARNKNKQVTVMVELKARFDEENNLEWARQLEDEGVHVTYGVEKLEVKTHAKICLVIRREEEGKLRLYVHLATGNYNSATARFYSDVGLFTCDQKIAEDATRLFNRLTGFAPATQYKRLLVAPEYLMQGILDLIDGEAKAALEGKPAHIIMKMNQLEEDKVIQHLYRASCCGVRIDLIVRGLCCLRPGIPGLSDNIRVVGITGRYLEHARIFYFQNAPAEQRMYFGSADMMRRNLYNRVEIVTPVIDLRHQQRLLQMLTTDLSNTNGAWEMQPDGQYVRLNPKSGELPFDSQSTFMQDSFGLPLPY